LAETLNEITVNYDMEGEQVIEELDKIVLQKGVWAVLLFRYREKNKKTREFGPPKVTLRRYQKFRGEYRKRDTVNLSKNSAQALVDILTEWIDAGHLGDEEE
jgi:oligoribonuclease NrnB/cAMP/cGMP phosphodiesterase (DHH superfamily)